MMQKSIPFRIEEHNSMLDIGKPSTKPEFAEFYKNENHSEIEEDFSFLRDLKRADQSLDGLGYQFLQDSMVLDIHTNNNSFLNNSLGSTLQRKNSFSGNIDQKEILRLDESSGIKDYNLLGKRVGPNLSENDTHSNIFDLSPIKDKHVSRMTGGKKSRRQISKVPAFHDERRAIILDSFSNKSPAKKKKPNSKKRTKRGPYNMISFEKRQKAVELADDIGLLKAAEQLNIPDKRIRKWMIDGPERKKGAGRRMLDPWMEDKLIDWLDGFVKHSNYFPPRSIIKSQARIISRVKSFKASKGWCDKFFKRKEERIRAIKYSLTTSDQDKFERS